MSVNKVILIGNLGGDPEVRNTPNGNTVATFSLATSEKWVGRDGNQHEDTEWHSCEVWDRQAEIAQKYLAKGSKVYVEGSIKTDSWEKDGQKRYKTKIRVFRFQMLGSKGAASAQTAPDDDIPF